jgi:hypothetical protein
MENKSRAVQEGGCDFISGWRIESYDEKFLF